MQNLEESIQRNDNRAPYRSKLLLDKDDAVRQTNQAKIYRDLGAGELAIREAARSLAQDPQESAAHRFLSDIYLGEPRQEVARVSELLQSQLLDPTGLTSNQPQLPFSDVNESTRAVFLAPGLNEYSVLPGNTRPRLSAAAQAGNNRTWGDELIVAKAGERYALSIGQFHYETDGFRDNNDIAHDIYGVSAAVSLTPSFTLQAEFRKRHTEHGDIILDFDPNDFARENRFEIDQRTTRLGATLRPNSQLVLLASLLDNRREEQQNIVEPALAIDIAGQSPGRQFELQLQRTFSLGNVILGAGSSRVDLDSQVRVVDLTGFIFGGACTATEPCDSKSENGVKQDNAYVYANLQPHRSLIATLGYSRDTFKDEVVNLRRWNPKFGFVWQAQDWLTLRAATFRTLKRTVVVDQTIEPTQIAGFNQFFDDANGTKTRAEAGAIDFQIGPRWRGTIQGSRRVLDLGPSLGAAGPFEEWNERAYGAALYWTPNPRTGIALRYKTDKFERDPLTVDDRPTLVETTLVPLTVRYFFGTSVMLSVEASYLKQVVRRLASSTKAVGEDSVGLVDFGVVYKLPKRLGQLSLTVKNALDKEFFYRDDSFRFSQVRLPSYQPARSIVLGAFLSF